MFDIIVGVFAEEQLDDFLNGYKNIFRDLFYDSGIFSEDIITQNYENTGDEFVDVVLGKIKNALSDELVLGRKISDSGVFSLIIHERSFLIIIDYTEDQGLQTRFIENIIFTKK